MMFILYICRVVPNINNQVESSVEQITDNHSSGQIADMIVPTATATATEAADISSENRFVFYCLLIVIISVLTHCLVWFIFIQWCECTSNPSPNRKQRHID
jgi:hypothetical protein